MNLNTKLGENCRGTSDEEEQGGEVKKHFHILAVDDSHIDRKLLERLLTISSYQVTCVDSGDKALEYLGLQIDANAHEKKTDEYGAIASSSPNLSQQNQDDQKVSKVVVNMIMTDYSMPGISGYDLLKRVKESSWKDIPVVVMSSEDIPSRINMCLESGAEEFLLKPVKLSDLSKLESHLHMNNSVMSINNSTTTTNDEDMNSILTSTAVTAAAGKNVESSKCNSNTSSTTTIHSNKIRKVATANLTSSSAAAALSDMMPRVTHELPGCLLIS